MDARAKCQAAGMDLVQIESAEENEFIRSKLHEESFIGATDSDVEGEWRWAFSQQEFWQGDEHNGAPIDDAYNNWNHDEPEDFHADQKDCGKIAEFSGDWRTDECTTHTEAYVCERLFDNDLVLVDDIRVAPDRDPSEPPRLADGQPNPEGLERVVVDLSEPIDPASFSLADNVTVVIQPKEAVAEPRPDPATVFSSVSFSNGNRRIELFVDPGEILSGVRYVFAVRTEGLELTRTRPTVVGIDAQSEVRAARTDVVRPDGTPPEVVSTSPAVGATDVPPHSPMRLLFSELMDRVPLQVSAASATEPLEAGLLFQPLTEPGASTGVARTALVSRPGQRLLVDTEYTIVLDRDRVRDVTGERLSPGDFEWTFHTAPIRIDSPSPGLEPAGTSLAVSGVVSTTATEAITVELRDPAGNLLSGPVTATRSSATAPEGDGTVNPWSATLALTSAVPPGSELSVRVGTRHDAVTMRAALDTQLGEAAEVAPGSPTPDESSPENPTIVLRDNPLYEGTISLREGESMNPDNGRVPDAFGYQPEALPTSPGDPAALSTSLSAGLVLPGGSLYRIGQPPLVPAQHGDGPGQFMWSVRGTRLAHDSTYNMWASVVRTLYDGFEGTNSENSLFLQLSDEVLLVPVVVIAWHGLNVGGDEDFALETATLWSEIIDATPGQRHPSTSHFINQDDPNRDPTPDNVWEQCNIQFRMIYSEGLPEDQTGLVAENVADNVCGQLGGPRSEVGGGQFLLDHRFDPEKAAALQDLGPIFINVGLFDCPSFLGRTVGKEIRVDRVDQEFKVEMLTTSHELGHALGLDHCEDTPAASECESRLMKQFNSNTSATELSESECEEARQQARVLSDRFDEYNQEFGPPNQHRFCCDVGEGPQFLPALICFGGPQRPSQVLRNPSECAQVSPPLPEPEPDGGGLGGVVPEECCLVDGGLTKVDEGTCPAGQVRPLDECVEIPR